MLIYNAIFVALAQRINMAAWAPRRRKNISHGRRISGQTLGYSDANRRQQQSVQGLVACLWRLFS